MAVENVMWQTGTGITLSNNNLTAIVSTHLYTVRANIGRSVGKYYFEIRYNSWSGNNACTIGLVNSSASLVTYDPSSTNMRGYYSATGYKNPENTAYGKPYNIGAVIGVFLDLDSGLLKYYLNGESQGYSHTNIKSLGTVYPSVKSFGTGAQINVTANFGASDFVYVPNDLPLDTLAYNGGKLTRKTIIFNKNNSFYLLEGNSILQSLTPSVFFSEKYLKEKNVGDGKTIKVNNIFSSKNYILQDDVSENADGLWVQELDRKPLSIKFE